MAKYLITGGAGFIGSHLAETLVSMGEDVVVLDNLATGKLDNLNPCRHGPGRLDFIQDDIRDLDACMKAMEGVEYVLHQAARPSVQRSVDNPLLSHDVNLNGGLNILKAAADSGVKRLVSASSSSVYGDRKDPKAPKQETMRQNPMSPYAANKVAMEYYCQVFYKVYGLETVCLRYFNVFGPRQDPHSHYAAVIPKFIFSMMDGVAPVIFGDGRQSRDFTYVTNVVNANLAACKADGVAGMVINVAAGENHDLLELTQIIKRLLGSDLEPEHAPARTGDVRHSLADISRARKYLDFEVGVGFEGGLALLVDLAKKGEYLPA